MGEFRLHASFEPAGDQPEAIEELLQGVREKKKYQTLLGVTGSGKTFTVANVIARAGLPALVISHNKTLAAQLYGEFKSFFPENAVEYFISYYDYYQPEAYVPQTDTYIDKEATVNEDIDRLRLRATTSLMERNDVVVVASVSCIYGLGSPAEYKKQLLFIRRGETVELREIQKRIVYIHYERNDIEAARGTFRARGDTLEIFPAYDDKGVRLEFFGDEVENIAVFSPVTGKKISELDTVAVYPAKHFVISYPNLARAIENIRNELKQRLVFFEKSGKLLEAQRLKTRTSYDLEMLKELGYCPGIENYSRHLAGRQEGDRPECLLDYFQGEFLTIIDESHVTVPQIYGMFNGDRSRKLTLVEHGFRLPSAMDNRPLRFEEFDALVQRAIFVSATPAEFELGTCKGRVVEQIIRPTGLVDPGVRVRPVKGQIDDLVNEIQRVVAREERVLVTTLTKRMAEDLTEYLDGIGIRVKYLHSEIEALNRVELIRGLRLREFDVLVGINLLREGLDIPEVSLVAILDADKEGFLRSARSLIQTSGRAARNINGGVIMYAEETTRSMSQAILEMERRRQKQIDYNRAHGITPRTISKSYQEVLISTSVADSKEAPKVMEPSLPAYRSGMSVRDLIVELETGMMKAAENLEFEKAAVIRDEIKRIKSMFNTGEEGLDAGM